MAIDNDDLQDLSQKGSYFIYDLDSLTGHAQQIVQGNAKIFFACKANPLSAILSSLHKAGIKLDVSSNGELNQVIKLGIPGQDIIMTGPARSVDLLELALQHRVSTFVIESPRQLFLLQKMVENYDYTPNILIRLQLHWELNEKSVIGGDKITSFGMDLETARELMPKITLPFLGFHVFQWGNVLSLEKLKQIWQSTIEACRSLKPDFKVLDVGGGLGIPYKGEKGLLWSEVNQVIGQLKQQYNIAEFWLELGRYMTGPYGKYITRVVDKKKTYNTNILVLKGGINHVVRPALVNEAFPASLLRLSKAKLEQFLLYGPLCTSLDCLGNVLLPEDTDIDDIVMFQQTGAYGFTQSMPLFLCHDWPGEAVIKNGKLNILREPQTSEFWLK